MEAAIVIAFREGMEAFLILGIVLAFLQQSGFVSAKRYAWAGFIAGVFLSLILAVAFALFIDGFESEDLQYNISLFVLFVAIILLTYMVFWMRHHSTASLTEAIGSSNNQKWITFFLIFSAVLREGLETALFSLSLVMEDEALVMPVLTGLVVGLLLSALVVALCFRWAVKMPIKQMFLYSSYLIIFIVAGLVSLLVQGLQGYRYLPEIISPLFNISFVLSNESVLGKVLQVLIGYDATPSLLQFGGWSLYLVSIFLIIKLRGKR